MRDIQVVLLVYILPYAFYGACLWVLFFVGIIGFAYLEQWLEIQAEYAAMKREAVRYVERLYAPRPHEAREENL